jgi:hypothetical protein
VSRRFWATSAAPALLAQNWADFHFCAGAALAARAWTAMVTSSVPVLNRDVPKLRLAEVFGRYRSRSFGIGFGCQYFRFGRSFGQIRYHIQNEFSLFLFALHELTFG